MLIFFSPARPVFFHALRNFRAFAVAHGFAASPLAAAEHRLPACGRPLQFLQRRNYAFELFFFGV